MLNAQLLEEALKKSGYRMEYICGCLGISPQAFHKKRKGEVAFKDKDIAILQRLCLLTPDEVVKIFFG